MAQTIRIRRTSTAVPPAGLGDGEMSAMFTAQTKLWVGSPTGNRLLISNDPADPGIAGGNYLPLTGGTLSGSLVLTPTLTVNGTSTNMGMVLSNSDTSIAMASGFGMWNTATNNGAGMWWSPTTSRLVLGRMTSAAGAPSSTFGWMNLTDAGVNVSVPLIMGLSVHVMMPAVPTDNQHVTNKLYVDDADLALAAQLANYLPLAGGTMTGELYIPLAAPAFDTQVPNKAYVDLQDTILQDQIDALSENLIFSGQIDIPGNAGQYTAASGITPNPGPLPAPLPIYRGFYIIVTTPGTPPGGTNIPAGTYSTGDWLVCDGAVWVVLHVGGAPVIAPEVDLSPAIPNLGTNVQTALTWLQANTLELAGGTMTGMIVLPATTPAGLQATTQTYVAAQDALRLALTGGTLTGPLLLAADPLVALGAATRQYVDAAVSGGMTGVVVADPNVLSGDGTVAAPLDVVHLDAGVY